MIDANRIMDSNLNILRLVLSTNKILAHQKPPSPDDKITKALAEEDEGMTENKELNTIKTPNMADIPSSAWVPTFFTLGTNT